MKVSVLGGGNGGFALAFHVAQLGHDVLLYEHAQFKPCIDEIQKSGSITAEAELKGSKAALSGKATIQKATYDIQEAVEFSNVAMIIVPAFGQIPIFESALPYLKENHLIITLPGNFAALEFAQICRERGIKKNLRFADTSSIPYACRKTSPSAVFISGLKIGMHVGVFPGEQTDQVCAEIAPLFSLKLRKSRDVIDCALHNPNLFLHPPTMVFNSGWIQASGGDFKFYHQGYQSCVAAFTEAIDRERVELLQKLGANPETCLEIMHNNYGKTDDTNIKDFVQKTPIYATIKSPPGLDNRYLTEDLSYLLVPAVLYLCPRVGVEATATKALITCAEVLTGGNIAPARHLKMVVREGEGVEDLKRRLQKWMD